MDIHSCQKLAWVRENDRTLKRKNLSNRPCPSWPIAPCQDYVQKQTHLLSIKWYSMNGSVVAIDFSTEVRLSSLKTQKKRNGLWGVMPTRCLAQVYPRLSECDRFCTPVRHAVEVWWWLSASPCAAEQLASCCFFASKKMREPSTNLQWRNFEHFRIESVPPAPWLGDITNAFLNLAKKSHDLPSATVLSWHERTDRRSRKN